MKTVAQKLFVKPGLKLRVLAKPDDFTEIFGPHEAVLLSERSKEPADVVLLFVRNRKELEDRLAKSAATLKPGGILWLAYPKGTSKLKSDIHRDSIREYGASVGLEAVSIIAINDDWSCLRFKILEAE